MFRGIGCSSMSGREIKWHVLKNCPVRFGEKIQHHVYGPCMGWLQQLWVLKLNYSWLRKAPQNLSRVDLTMVGKDGQSWLRWINKPIQLIQSVCASHAGSLPGYVMPWTCIYIYIYILYATYKCACMNAVLAFKKKCSSATLSKTHQHHKQQKVGR